MAGRPSDYSPELAALICQRMSEGNSIRTICKADDMPSPASIYLWLSKHKEFSEQYTRASEERAHALAEEALEIADDSSDDYIETEDGPRLNSEHVQRSRLRVDTRKWFASKLAPKKYGDKVQNEHSGPDGGPIKTIHRVERHVVDPKPQD